MSTFVLTTASTNVQLLKSDSPKLGPLVARSMPSISSSPQQHTSEAAEYHMTVPPTHSLPHPSASAFQFTVDDDAHQSKTITLSPFQKPSQVTRSARVRALPSVTRPQQSSRPLRDERAGRQFSFHHRHDTEFEVADEQGRFDGERLDAAIKMNTGFTSQHAASSSGRLMMERSGVPSPGASARFSHSGARSPQGAGLVVDEATLQRKSRLLALISSRRDDEARGVWRRPLQ